MLRVIVDRGKLAEAGPRLFEGGPETAALIALLDRHEVPDGFPFVVDDDGTIRGCRFLNGYLLAAMRQNAYSLESLRNNHLYPLTALLRWIRMDHAKRAAQQARMEVEEWLAVHGEPSVDLTDATRQELIAYGKQREQEIGFPSWQTQGATIAGFFYYAHAQGWIETDPIPRWGRARRNTLTGRKFKVRKIRFLLESQLRLYLKAGLRGDAPADPAFAPTYPERDYAFGLTLAATALRREECAWLLDCEIPTPGDIGSNGVAEFDRYGKGGVTRRVYIALEYSREVDIYRRGERRQIIQAAQRTLRKYRRDGRLLMVERVEPASNGASRLKIDGRWHNSELLDNADRGRAVRVLPDGTLEPLCLFVGRYGLPPDLKQWNAVFSDGHKRVVATGHADIPPAHLKVTPHVMRHTFAVRMLSGLMRVGHAKASNPYLLLTNPVLTVQQILGHASPETTQQYLYLAERYTDELPAALRTHVASVVEGKLRELEEM